MDSLIFYDFIIARFVFNNIIAEDRRVYYAVA